MTISFILNCACFKLYCGYFNLFVMCGCFGNMYTSIYCVCTGFLYCFLFVMCGCFGNTYTSLYCVCIVCTGFLYCFIYVYLFLFVLFVLV